MTIENEKQQAQPQTGPIAQQLAKIQTNGHQPLSNEQQSLAGHSQKKTTKWRWDFSNKTGWDWLNLFGVFLVPLMIGVFTVVNTVQQNEMSQQQHQTDFQLAADQQQDMLLQTYLARMSDLLLVNKLRTSRPGDEVRNIARGWTQVTLHRLDGTRKGALLRFLYEANLISIQDTVISLYASDLRQADLRATDLHDANLSGAWLEKANLSDVNLARAVLDGARLQGAIITNEQLTQVKSLKGTIMPDGSIHP